MSGCHCPRHTLPFDGHTCCQKRKGAEEEEEGPPLAIILGGGGGEKTRRAGHLWCVSVICSDWGYCTQTHTHTLLGY